MPRFHVSADGTPRPCNAEAGNCPLSEEDGSPTPHGEFASASEAQAFAESVNAKRFGGAFAKKVGPDRSKIKPAFENEAYARTKPLEGGNLDDGLPTDGEYYEEYSNYQDFSDASGDVDGYQLELEKVTSVFSDSGEVLSSEIHYERATYEDEDQRADGVAGLLTPEDAAELTSDNEIVREKWIDPNVRVTYRVMTYDLV